MSPNFVKNATWVLLYCYRKSSITEIRVQYFPMALNQWYNQYSRSIILVQLDYNNIRLAILALL